MAAVTPIQKVFAQVHSPRGMAFPQVVAALVALGVTRYHIDYVASTATTYKPASTGSSTSAANEAEMEVEVESLKIPSPAVSANMWNQAGLANAIRRVQNRETTYGEFAQQCVDAGVVGYLAFLTGKRVLYYGSRGDMHVEWFPGAGPKEAQ